MAKVNLPRYTRAKKVKKGVAYFWELPHWARPPAEREGKVCPVRSTALGTDLGSACTRANVLNEALDAWRKGKGVGVSKQGTVRWIFTWYQNTSKFKRLGPKTKLDYRKHMKAIADLPMKRGVLGERIAAKIDAEAADNIYERMQERGRRQATYSITVFRLVWNWAGRYPKKTGLRREDNPFSGMALDHSVQKGNRAATRQEYEAYRRAARELGFQSMATASALSFELVQRVSDVFGFEDPEDPDLSSDKIQQRGIRWADYSPGEKIVVCQHKTKKRLGIPLTVREGTERIHLYPELEDELSRLQERGDDDLIVTEERNGLPYKPRRMSDVHRTICNHVGLPKDLTFTSFRHGGATELGDAGEADIRSISGHSGLKTSLIYNKESEEKARGVGLRRRKHIDWISNRQGDDDDP